ncbi:MAG: serine--tRNA ligase [Eubacteriaceae bacterium]|nr:serine--tRNA ligase [Eubacteriaceae bacterium]
MLDIKQIRENPEAIVARLNTRNGNYSVDKALELDAKRREILGRVEELKAKKNQVSKEIPKRKMAGEELTPLFKEMKEVSNKIKADDDALSEIDVALNKELLVLPNLPKEDVVVGKDDSENKEIRKWGEPRVFDFDLKAHWDLGTDLDILDFERAVKITGARFSMFKGLGAKLERALINFMLQVHTSDQDYTEISPPFMINRASMTGTGQLPKFEEDAFHLEKEDFFMAPTAEVPLTNIFRGEILEIKDLPYHFTAYTPCFREEAGSAGRDTRGLIRNHQFDKVEMVKIVNPDDSYDELESLTNDAEAILQELGLPYRVVELCTGDLGFSAAKTYDIEVWMPSYGRYVEISSCSNCEGFQARRANIRYRDPVSKHTQFVHTLNGSGLAVGRTFAAVLENYQNADGSITIPEKLRHFMGGLSKIEK